MAHYVAGASMETLACGKCGGVYALTERFLNESRDNRGEWACPYCKTGWGFFGPTKAEQLQKQLDAEKERRRWAEQERDQVEHRRRAQKAAHTRLKNRVGAGVCPCCKRSFKALRAHIANKHPGYVGPEVDDA